MNPEPGFSFESNFMKPAEFEHQEEGEPPIDDMTSYESTDGEDCSEFCRKKRLKFLQSSSTTRMDEIDKSLANEYETDFEVVVHYFHGKKPQDEVEYFSVEYLRCRYQAHSVAAPPRRLGIILRNAKKLREPVRSGICYVNNIPWRLTLIPRSTGCKDKNEPVMGIFVQCCVDSYSDLWKCNAQAEIILKGNTDFKRRTSHYYTPKESDWGYSSFITLKELFNDKEGYLKAGAVGVEVILNNVEATGIMGLSQFREKISKYRKISEMQRDKGFTDKAIECITQGIELCERYSDIQSLRELLQYKNDLINHKLEESIKRIESGTVKATIDASCIVKGSVPNEAGKLINKTARALTERKKKSAVVKTSNVKSSPLKCTECVQKAPAVNKVNQKSSSTPREGSRPEVPLCKPSTSKSPSLNSLVNEVSQRMRDNPPVDADAGCGSAMAQPRNNEKENSKNTSSMCVDLDRGDPVVIIDLILHPPELGHATEHIMLKHEVSEILSVEEIIEDVVGRYVEEWQDDPNMKRFIPELKRVAYGDEFAKLMSNILDNINRKHLERLSKDEYDTDQDILMLYQQSTIAKSSEEKKHVREEILKCLSKKKKLREIATNFFQPEKKESSALAIPADIYCDKCREKVKDIFKDYGKRFHRKLIQFLKFVRNYYYSTEFTTAYSSILRGVKDSVCKKGMDADCKIEEFPIKVEAALQYFERWDPLSGNPLELLIHFHYILDVVFLPIDSFLPQFNRMTKDLKAQNQTLIKEFEKEKLMTEEIKDRLQILKEEHGKVESSTRHLKEENKKYKKKEKSFISEIEKYRKRLQSAEDHLKVAHHELDETKGKLSHLQKELAEKSKSEQSLKDSKKRLQSEVKENQSTIKQLRDQLEKSKECCKKLEQKKVANPVCNKPSESSRIKQLEKELDEYKLKEKINELEKALVVADLSLKLIQKRKKEGSLSYENSRELDTQELCWSSYEEEVVRYMEEMKASHENPDLPPSNLRMPVAPSLLKIPPVIVVQKVVEVKPVYLSREDVAKFSPGSSINFPF
uniref:MATH domain-containing protein n=1 Tax=Bursaphelenchus xylophilus TaxID=6326 RepID=A0A1I7RR32_BURXY